jgi:hypothetical protein
MRQRAVNRKMIAATTARAPKRTLGKPTRDESQPRLMLNRPKDRLPGTNVAACAKVMVSAVKMKETQARAGS